MHVARPDLEAIGVALYDWQVSRIHDLSNHGQASFVPCIRQKPKAIFAQALKAVRGGARLEGAPAQDARARILDGARDGEKLLAAFNRAGPADKGNGGIASDAHTANLDGGSPAPGFTTTQT